MFLFCRKSCRHYRSVMWDTRTPGDYALLCGVYVIQNKQNKNNKKQQTSFLIIAACDHLLLCESVAGSKPQGCHLVHRSHDQMLAPSGASGSRIDSRMLNNFQSNFHTEQNKGPMVCLEGEEKKDSVFGSILCCYSGGKQTGSILDAPLHYTCYIHGEKKFNFINLYIYTHVLLYGDKENDNVFTYLHNVLFQ